MVAALLLAGVLAAPAYWMVRSLAGVMGYSMFPGLVSLPNTLLEIWVVVPGAVVLGGLLYLWLERLPLLRRPFEGAAWGAALGLLNVPLSVLIALMAFHLTTPWRYGAGCLLEEWVRQLPLMIWLGAPVGATTGVLLGGMLGLLAHRQG